MIFLIFSCRVAGGELKLNPEFADHAWVKRAALGSYDLNAATIETFKQVGVLEKVDATPVSRLVCLPAFSTLPTRVLLSGRSLLPSVHM